MSQAVNNYDNILIAGNLNIDLSECNGQNDNHFSELIDIFNLTNLVKNKTCFKAKRGSLLDVLLTNKPGCFQKTSL